MSNPITDFFVPKRRAKRLNGVKRPKGTNRVLMPGSAYTNIWISLVPSLAAWLIILAAIFAVVFVRSKMQLESMEGKIASAKSRKIDLNSDIKNIEAKWEKTKAPSNMRVTLVNRGIEMNATPKPSQIIVINRISGNYGAVKSDDVEYASK